MTTLKSLEDFDKSIADNVNAKMQLDESREIAGLLTNRLGGALTEVVGKIYDDYTFWNLEKAGSEKAHYLRFAIRGVADRLTNFYMHTCKCIIAEIEENARIEEGIRTDPRTPNLLDLLRKLLPGLERGQEVLQEILETQPRFEKNDTNYQLAKEHFKVVLNIIGSAEVLFMVFYGKINGGEESKDSEEEKADALST